MQTAEARLARSAFVWLLLAMGEQMALEIVVSSEVGRAIRAFVALRRWRFVFILGVTGQAHLALRGTGIVVGSQRTWEGHGTVAWDITGVGGNGLVVMVVVVVMLMLRWRGIVLALSLQRY